MKFTASAAASPTTGGTAVVSDNGTQTIKSGGNWFSGYTQVSATFSYSATVANSNYVFKGWSTSATANSGTTTNPMSLTYYGTGGRLGTVNVDSDTQYAIFARLTADQTSLSFDKKNVKSGWGNEQSVSVTYVHVGTMTATITGDHKDDFSFKNNESSQSTTVVSNNTNTETSSTVTVYFNPQCDGTRTATLTFSGNGLTKTVSLSGTGDLNVQTLSWDNENAIVLNMLKGATQDISATSKSGENATGLKVSYSSDNTNVLKVDANGKLTAIAVGSATITASQAGEECTYKAAANITKKFNVKSKDTPIFTPNGFSEGTTNALKVDDEVTLDVSYVSDGLDGDFKASATKVNNQDVLKITRNGNTITIKALREGTSTATFTQTENASIFGATKSYTFSVTKVDNTLSVKGNNYTRYVEEDDDLTPFVTKNSDGTIHASSTAAGIAHYDITNDKIVIDNSSNASFKTTTVTIKIWQDATIKYAGITEANAKTITLTVNKYPTSFSGSNYNLKVDDTQTADYVYTNTSAAQPTANSSDDFYYTIDEVNFTKVEKNKGNDLVTFDPATKKITACNAGSAKITLHQEETYIHTGATKSFNVTVTKYDNSLSCSWGSWSKDMYVDSEVATTISATANPSTPIVKVIKGDSIAEFKNNKIKTNCNLGVAKWEITQAETYKYKEATPQTLTVNVKKESDGNCEVTLYESTPDIEASKIGELPLGGVVGVKLYFSMKKKFAGANANLSLYNSKTGKWSDETVTAKSVLYYDNQTRDLADENGEYHITKIKFGSQQDGLGTDDPYINNIKVTCQKYFNLQDEKKKNISNLEMTNYVGGNSTTATFYVNYSTCADVIKIKSNNAHVTVSPTSINTSENHFGRQEITLTYASDAEEDINAVITAYTQYENQTLNVHAATVKIPQELTWSEDFEGDEITLPLTFACNDAATASTNLPVKYSTADDKIIQIAADSLSFSIIGTGVTTLTATQAGNDQYQAVSGTKTITASSKKVQVISWSQNLNRAQNTGDEITLKAQVKVFTNIANNELEYSAERTKLIKYTCPANNNVIEITKDSAIRVIGFGTTTITAKVDGNDEYEASAAVVMPVRIREKKTGDCEASLAFYQGAEIEFVQTNTSIYGSIARPEITQTVDVSDLAGEPDSLTFDVRGVADDKGNFEGDIEVYESTDGGKTFSGKKGAVTGAQNAIKTSDKIALSKNVTTLKFVRPQGGRGYHYVGNIQITSKPFIRMAKNASTTVNVGYNIALGAVKKQKINIEYSSAKGNLNVTTAPQGSAGLTVENQIDVECGVVVTYPLDITVAPTSSGSWSNTITITDPKQPTLKLDITLTATVAKGSQEIVWNPEQNITTIQAPILNAYATSELDVSYKVTDGGDVASIVNGQVVIAKDGEFTITVTQGGNNDYNAAEDLVKTFTVSKATPTLEWAKAPQELACNASSTIYEAQSTSDEGAITYAITAGKDYATIDATTGELTIRQFGKEITIQASQAQSIKFNAPDPITVDVTIAALPDENTFTNNVGDNDWNNPANWEIGFTPMGENPNVVINGDLDVEGDEPLSVGGLTIKTGATVTIKDGATLVVDGESQARETYGNIVVEAGGKLNLNGGEVNVNDFTLYSGYGADKQPKSGQVINADKIYANDSVRFILDITPEQTVAEAWYDITVPFPVNALTGVTRFENGEWKELTYDTHYGFMDYHEDVRARGQNGWKWYRGILKPGVLYSFATDATINRYCFTMAKGSTINTDLEHQLQATQGQGEVKHKGWNGIGNGTMTYAKLEGEYLVQMLSHDNDEPVYKTVEGSEHSFAVGAAYFVQVGENCALEMSAETNASNPLRAPQRSAESESSKRISVTLAANGHECDNFFVTCDDDASDTYTIGKDLTKMGKVSGTKIARMWTNAKGGNLCAVHKTYNGNEAIIPLSFYAPKNGEYTLSLNNYPEEDVYLTRNGIIVWDLNMSEYTFDLNAGTDSSYALQVVRRVQNTATGVDNATDNDNRGTIFAEKMIVNGQLFILRDGILYDAQGKKVKTR